MIQDDEFVIDLTKSIAPKATPHKFKIESLNKNTASIYDLFKDSTFIAKIGEVDDEDTKREHKGKVKRPSRKLAADEIFV